MNVGSLFVTLGIKGGGKAKKDVLGVNSEIKGLSKSSLGAIAALTGITLGLKSLYDGALRTGTAMTKFGNTTGMSTDLLQRWQYVARQSGVASEEIESNFRNLQSSLEGMNLSNSWSGELKRIFDFTGGDWAKIKEAPYVFEQIQKYLKGGFDPIGMSNQVAGSLVTPDVIGMLRSTNLRPEDVSAGNITSAGQAKRLQQIQAAAANVQAKMQNSANKIIAELGPELIKNFNRLIPVLEDLTRVALGILGYVMRFAVNPGEQTANAAAGLTESAVWKQLFEDLMPWTAEKLKGFSIPETSARWANEIQNSKNGMDAGAGGVDVKMTNNFYGSTKADAQANSNKIQGDLKRVQTQKMTGKVQ